MSAIFGPAGNAESFPYKSSVDAPRWLAELGLDCYEYQCGKGVNVREETARNIGAAAVAAGIRLSLHAPYFINLANPDPESLQKTIGYITAACQAADWMGAGRVVIHSGALMKRTRREALDIALRSLKAVIAACDDAGYGHIALCPETMGKINQLGDLDEVLELCTLDERLYPAWTSATFTPAPWGSWRGLRPARPCWTASGRYWGRCGPVSSTATSPRFSLPPTGARRCI